jgi:hypothetical protein
VSDFQCSFCELRFRFASELDDHITRDHPKFTMRPKSLEDSLLAASHHKRHWRPRYQSDGGSDRKAPS